MSPLDSMASAIWVECIQPTYNQSFWTFGTHKPFAFWSNIIFWML